MSSGTTLNHDTASSVNSDKLSIVSDSSSQITVTQSLDKIHEENNLRVDTYADHPDCCSSDDDSHGTVGVESVSDVMATLTSQCVALTTDSSVSASDGCSLLSYSHVEEITNGLSLQGGDTSRQSDAGNDAKEMLCRGRTTFKTHAMTDNTSDVTSDDSCPS